MDMQNPIREFYIELYVEWKSAITNIEKKTKLKAGSV